MHWAFFSLAVWGILMWTLPRGLALFFLTGVLLHHGSYDWLSSNHSGLCLNATSSSYCSLTLPKLLFIILSYIIFFKGFSFCNVLISLFYNIFFQSSLWVETSSIFSLLCPSTKSTSQHMMTVNICWLYLEFSFLNLLHRKPML